MLLYGDVVKYEYFFYRNHEDAGEDRAQVENAGGSESESESSQRSSTGKDFEMVDQTELE